MIIFKVSPKNQLKTSKIIDSTNNSLRIRILHVKIHRSTGDKSPDPRGISLDISKTCFLDNSGRENIFSAFLTCQDFCPPPLYVETLKMMDVRFFLLNPNGRFLIGVSGHYLGTYVSTHRKTAKSLCRHVGKTPINFLPKMRCFSNLRIPYLS